MPDSPQISSNLGKTLVAFFSHSGNTRNLARHLQEAAGTDVFEIKPATPYPTEYDDVVEQAEHEQKKDYRPPLQSNGPDLKNYRLIFIGSPNWWNTIAPPVKTFLEAHDFAGKTIVPFITHEGSGAGKSRQEVQRICSLATVLDSRAFWGNDVKNAGGEVRQWLRGLEQLK
jgi:flavodoxin